MGVLYDMRHAAGTDVNLKRAREVGASGARALPSASLSYVLDKIPVVGWLPRYNPRWILNDVVAGLTVGLLLMPQSLSYAKVATIPTQFGLFSSWLPAIIYVTMGTSKDLSTGPTSLIGLLTADAVKEFSKDGYPPQVVASAVAMMMGIYSIIIGFLKLGFILDFISVPVLSGFMSAAGITICLSQVDSLLGESNVGDGTATIIHDVFAQIRTANVYAAIVGFSGILLLVALQYIGSFWGRRSKILLNLSNCRATVTLVIFTAISFGINKDRQPDDYVFEVIQVEANGIPPPKMIDSQLLRKVAQRSVAAFIAAAVEHTSIGRAFAARNNYVIDQSQELCYLGVANFFNSLFGAMGVSGAVSRTAVNSQSGVKSPLSGLVTAGFVILSIFKLTETLYWIPKATLAAIIITAVWPVIGSPRTYYQYWRTSLVDFVASMISFWVSLFVSTEVGIGSAVLFGLACVILQHVFTKPRQFDSVTSRLAVSSGAQSVLPQIPPETRVFQFNESLYFPNANRVKAAVLDAVQTYHSGLPSDLAHSDADRGWSVVGEKRVSMLRRKANITGLPPSICVVVLDFSKVNHLDTTAISVLRNLCAELRKYAGASVAIRFSALADNARERFARGGWDLRDGDELGDTIGPTTVEVFKSIGEAVTAPRLEFKVVVVENEKGGH